MSCLAVGLFTLWVPKETTGEHFEGLQMLTSLLAPKGSRSAKPLVEDLSTGKSNIYSSWTCSSTENQSFRVCRRENMTKWCSVNAAYHNLLMFQQDAVKAWEMMKRKMRKNLTGRLNRRCTRSALRRNWERCRRTASAIRGLECLQDYRWDYRYWLLPHLWKPLIFY